MVTDLQKKREIVAYDTRVHEALNLQWLYTINKIHVVTKGMWTCPMRSFFVLCHNQPIENIQDHPLILLLKPVQTSEQLKELSDEILPPSFDIDFKAMGLKSLAGVKLHEFSHAFYQERFRNPTLSGEFKKLISFRVCAFVDLGEENKANIPLSQAFASRFVTILPTSVIDERYKYPKVEAQ